MELTYFTSVFVVIINCVLTQPPPPIKECIAQRESGQCLCKMSDDSSIIDITSLGVPDAPKFKDTKGDDGNTYSYDPCNSFSEGGCQKAAMCLSSGELQTNIGQAGEMEYQYDMETKNVVVAYIARLGTRLAISEVQLICDPNACEPKFEAMGQQQQYLYKFKMTTVCACANQCTSSGPINCKTSSAGAIGGGSIVLIIAVVVLTLYITAGVLFQKIKKNASGTDLLPNKEFWKGLPGLIKGGVLFTFSKCLRNQGTYKSTN